MGPHSTAWVARISDEAIRASWGDATFLRGRSYEAAGHVLRYSTNRTGSIEAVVRGTGKKVYRTFLHHDQKGVNSTCSCPMRMRCKHAVAVLLAARESAMETVSPVSSWENVLAGLLPATGSEDRTIELGLEFRIDGPLEQPNGLTLRPLRLGARGWGKCQAGWLDVVTNYRGVNYEPVQRETLLQMARLTGRQQYTHAIPASVSLADLGPLGWSLLRRAVDAGIQLIPGQGIQDVEVGCEPVRIWLDVDFRDDGSRQLTISGDLGPIPPDGRRFLIGEPAHGVGELGAGGRLRLYPLAGTVPDAIRGLFNKNLAVTIPAQDVGRFQLMYLPGLVHRGLVPPGTWDPQDLPHPKLALGLTHEPGHRLLLEWGFKYVFGETSVDVAFQPHVEETFRDRETERSLEGVALRLVGDYPALCELRQQRLIPKAAVTRADAARFVTDILPRLEAAGVIVTHNGEVPGYVRATEGPVLSVGTEDTGDNDWFNLHVRVTVAGRDVPFEQLFRALAAGDEAMLLDDGTWFPMEHSELDRLRQLLIEARELVDAGPGGQLRISAYQAGLWEELARLGVVEEQPRRWRERVQTLLSLGSGEARAPVPEGLDAMLRPYQEQGLAWLAALWDANLGGVLADDMGLGKTLQCLALLERARERAQLDDAPVLAVAPASVVGTWAEEAARFVPGLKVVAIRATQARRGTELAEEIRGAHLVATSYTLLRMEDEAYLEQTWRGLVLDEAQFIKNHRSRTHQVARRIGAPFTLAITGTPLENSLSDLWSMFSLVAPGLFPRLEGFNEIYRKPVEKNGKTDVLGRLRARIRPFMLRRTKREVLRELPEKVEQITRLELTPEHRRRYDQHLTRERTRVLGMLDDMDRNRVAIFRALTKLRQLALEPRLVDTELPPTPSAKITTLLEQIRELAEEGHRALVFSSFTGFLKLVREALEAEGIEYVYLDGRTRDRPARIAQFREGDAPVFLISLKAGGFGLTLTEADYVFVLDPWWNPAAENQAVDRAHRIGQTRAVNVYRMVSADTIEEKVVALQQRKRDLFASVIDTGEFRSTAITASDIRGLLE